MYVGSRGKDPSMTRASFYEHFTLSLMCGYNMTDPPPGFSQFFFCFSYSSISNLDYFRQRLPTPAGSGISLPTNNYIPELPNCLQPAGSLHTHPLPHNPSTTRSNRRDKPARLENTFHINIAQSISLKPKHTNTNTNIFITRLSSLNPGQGVGKEPSYTSLHTNIATADIQHTTT